MSAQDEPTCYALFGRGHWCPKMDGSSRAMMRAFQANFYERWQMPSKNAC
jgi:hypothetical protein